YSSAEQQFKRLANQNSEDLDIKKQFAAFYQDGAFDYQQVLPLAGKTKQTEIEERITHYLSSSIPLLKEVTKANPDEKAAWHDLYQAYTYLGMKAEAKDAKSNF
ncbi:MAG TPA: hypothetical protein VJ964_09180, partial [Balneolaceae bacterium]|nr:hypothetical protein [Balneolaceae bacterium]